MQHESEDDKTAVEEVGIRFNPNVFTEFKLAGTPEVILHDHVLTFL